jgi:hypothetical protein
MPDNDPRLIDIMYYHFIKPSDHLISKLETRLIEILPILDNYCILREFYLSEFEILKMSKFVGDEDKKFVAAVVKSYESGKPSVTDAELHPLINKYFIDYFSRLLVIKTTFASIEPLITSSMKDKSKYLQMHLEDLKKILARFPAGSIEYQNDRYDNVEIPILITTVSQLESKFRLVINTRFHDI